MILFRNKSIIFYIVLLIICSALAAVSKNYDPDLWARLIAGMAIVQTGSVLKEDFLSYTPTHTWWDHEWGSSLVFYLTQHYTGHIGLLLLQIVLIFLTFVFIVKTVKLRCNDNCNPYNFVIYFIALNAFLATYSFVVRCHYFTFLFFAITLYILELARKGNTKHLVLLPLLVVIWNNMHGGVVSGIGIMFLYAVGEFLNKKPYKSYLWVFCISVIALLINPYGIEYVTFLLSAVTMVRPDIVEWWHIFYKIHIPHYWDFKLYSFGLLIVELIKLIKNKFNYVSLDKTKFLVLAVTFVSAVKHVKLIPFFAITGTIFIYEDIIKLFDGVKLPFWGNRVVGGVLLIYAIAMLSLQDYKPMVDNSIYPVAEVEFVRINKLKGNVLTNFGLGSYTAYKLYPQNKIFMDGRYEEVYYEGLIPMLNRFFIVREDWDAVLKKYPTDILIVEKYYDVYKKLLTEKDWYFVFGGIQFAVFVKKDNLKEHYKMPNNQLSYYRKHVFDTMIDFKK